MELLANYDDGSNTPKTDRNGEDSTTNMEAEYDRMMNSFEMDGANAASTQVTISSTANTTDESMPWLSKRKTGTGDSSSGSDSSSGEDSGSDDEEKTKKDKMEKHEESASSDYSSDSSSASGSSKQEKESAKQPIAERAEEKLKRASTSSIHTTSARKRSRSGSHGRRHRRSTERRRRSSSRSRDRRHRHHRSERKSSHRSRSRSHSKDRHRSRRSSKERRRRDSHRRRRSGSRDAHRRRRRRASSSHRRRHKSRSRSPEHKKHRPEKSHRNHSPSRSGRNSREEEAGGGSGPAGGGSSRPPFRTAGLKFGRGRGNPNGFKEQLKKEFIQNCSAIQTAVNANPNQPTIVPPLMRSNVATTSAGLGGAAGDITTVILNQMQQVQKLVGQQPMPGGLTQEQMIINQQAILKATGRTREQVEAETGIKVPEYYNEINYNVKEWAEREKKRKTLFKKKPEDANRLNSQFSAKALLPGADSVQAEKFSRLLGVKKHMNPEDNQQKAKEELEEAERQEVIRDDLSKTYDSARVYTHLARGSGLGYTNTLYQPLG